VDEFGKQCVEQWKDIPKYEGVYSASDLGRIMRMGTNKTRKPKIRCQSINHKGYLECSLHKDGIRKKHMSHRLVAMSFIPNPENKPEVNHKKGVKKDNRPTELEWVTAKENSQHSIETGLQNCKGENSSKAKITNEQARDIKFSKSSTKEMMSKYKVSNATIYKIRNNKVWKHIN